MTTKVFTVEEMIAAEKAADASGVSYGMMMEIAGRSVAEAIVERVPVQDRNVLILVGPGNNGGDGLVVGRHLAEADARVTFYFYRSRDPGQDHNYAQIIKMALPVIEAELDQGYEQLRNELNEAEIIIDALLGTGVARPIGGDLAVVFANVRSLLERPRNEFSDNQRLASTTKIKLVESVTGKRFVTAVDCPSGLNCDTGELDPLAIAADLTVTFAGPKRGHFRFPGASACGELVVADIDISTDLPEVARVPLELATPKLARELLPMRASGGHKGSFGTALIVGGSEHYWGAPLLAGQGAYRVGAGLVALAVPQVIRPTAAGQLPEATYPPLPAVGLLDAESAGSVSDMFPSIKGILVGPGLGPAEEFMRELLAEMSMPHNKPTSIPSLVVDADGLNILSRWSQWSGELPANSILTPHPGEMARLMDVTPAEVKMESRVELARSQAVAWGHNIVLKGAYTVVAAPDGRCTIMPYANPLLAVGGSGDVLAGIIVGLLAQGLQPYEAAALGAYLHGASAELASAAKFGDAGLLSGELAEWVPEVRRRLLSYR